MESIKKETTFSDTPLVLIVDDIEENVEVLYSILKGLEYRFAIAFNVEQTLQAVGREIPDLILLDVMLPDGNGFRLAEKILEKYPRERIPIIFITARAHIEDKVEGFRVGGVDYITKPFEESEVLARVKTHLELRKVHNEQERLIKRLQEALAEVKQLRGILPICANCKKIRDDEGYWIQVDQYLRQHSELEFSHGLCPVCMQELYPDLILEKDLSGRKKNEKT